MTMSFNSGSFPKYESLANAIADGDINKTIAQLSTYAKPQQDFLFANIKEFKDSDKYKDMQTAQKYYRNKSDITERKKYYIGRKGEKYESNILSNTKLAHPFMYKLTNQKVNYLLCEPYTLESEDENYIKLLEENYFDKDFVKMLRNITRHAITNGISWVQAYYNEKGALKFKRIPSDQVVPFWGDDDHTKLEAVIRFYTINRYLESGGKKPIVKVEYYTPQGIWYYQQSDTGLIDDPDRAKVDAQGVQEPQAHFAVETKDETTGESVTSGALWDRVPFVPFKYNPDEISLLEWVKSLIDDYDYTSSDLSNMLKDVPNAVKVVKGYSGKDKEEFTHNLATFRTAFVDADGGIEAVETPVEAESTDIHLTRLRKDIFEGGCGVDTQETDLGNASGVAIRFRYADLDNDMAVVENEFQQAFEELAWFVDVDLFGRGNGDFTSTEFKVKFNKVGIVNESDIITDCKNSVGVISNKTILSHHPWVNNADDELKNKEEEDKAQFDKDLEQTKKLSALNNPTGGSTGGGQYKGFGK